MEKKVGNFLLQKLKLVGLVNNDIQRTITIYRDGPAVSEGIASGFLEIKEAPVFKIKPTNEYYVPTDEEQELIDDPFLNTDSVIKSIKISNSLIKTG